MSFAESGRDYDCVVDGIFYQIISYSTGRFAYVVHGAGYSGDVVIPSSIDYNGRTYQVTDIRDWAFDGCRHLRSVYIPASIKNIDGNIFEGCDELERIIIDPNNTIYDSRDNCNAVIKGDALLSGCKKTTIPSGVTKIGDNAFYGCIGLTSIDLPDEIISIGWNAFEGCTNLRKVNLKEGLSSIGQRAFSDCTNLEEIKIPQSTKSIGDYAFENCYNLERISILGNISELNSKIFSGCNNITKAHFNCKIIQKEYSLPEFSALEELSIGDSILTIGKGTFEDYENLKRVVLPKNLKGIGQNAFAGCINLSEITFSDSLKWIGRYAFRNCRSLDSIYIPKSVEEISNLSFYRCSGLQSIIVDKDNHFFDSRDNCNAIIKDSELVLGCNNSFHYCPRKSVNISLKRLSALRF